MLFNSPRLTQLAYPSLIAQLAERVEGGVAFDALSRIQAQKSGGVDCGLEVGGEPVGPTERQDRQSP